MLTRLRRRLIRSLDGNSQALRNDNADIRRSFDGLALELRDLNATTTNDYRALVDQLRSEIDHVRTWVEDYNAAVRAHLDVHANEAVDRATESLQTRLRRLERTTRAAAAGAPPAAAAAPATAPPVAAPPASAPPATAQAAVPRSESISSLGIDYSSFEDQLRGSVEHVRALEAPHVETVAGFGAEGLPVLDVGCGRGEFLQLLTEAGIPNRGIDLNPESVDDCKEAGHDVVLGDAVAYLRSLEPASLRAVCGFHLVEHLSDPDRTELFLAADHAIAPGGGIIFETPNPENLRVGSTNFWLDPTHLRPVPPRLLQFQAEQAGFDDVSIVRLHPSDERINVDGDIDPALQSVVDFVNGLIAGPMDYAVVATRPSNDS